jgi:hypothetical protein
MKKTEIARANRTKIARSRLGRMVFRPLGLAELGHVAGAGDPPAGPGEVETDGIWALEGDGIQY